jgi:P-aminobenzoate N-oxygenase AurF
MDLEKMKSRCIREQWSLDMVSWDAPVAPTTPEREEAIVQCFTDMAAIERLAAALFEEQARRAESPTLRRIFESFVADELRHSEAALRLAARHDVRKLRPYAVRPALRHFAASFVEAVRHLSPDVANAYIMVGEVILDVALLRSLDDAARDPVTSEVMKLVNRDESRHIAIDFHMFDHYSSAAYAQRAALSPARPAAEQVAGAVALCRMLRHARPFFRQVFVEPMAVVDPSGRRLREAVKRLQLLLRRPGADRQPFVRFIASLFAAYQHRAVRAALGPVLERLVGVEPALLQRLYTERDVRRADAMTMDELAAEAAAAKLAA